MLTTSSPDGRGRQQIRGRGRRSGALELGAVRGGPRRRYEITVAGTAVLDRWARELCGLRNTNIEFIERYESDHHDHEPLADIPSQFRASIVGIDPTIKRTVIF